VGCNVIKDAKLIPSGVALEMVVATTLEKFLIEGIE
jgi:hypothetical protein